MGYRLLSRAARASFSFNHSKWNRVKRPRLCCCGIGCSGRIGLDRLFVESETQRVQGAQGAATIPGERGRTRVALRGEWQVSPLRGYGRNDILAGGYEPDPRCGRRNTGFHRLRLRMTPVGGVGVLWRGVARFSAARLQPHPASWLGTPCAASVEMTQLDWFDGGEG
jgi:hypothetical protein